MERGAYVCICIKFIKRPYYHNKDIVPLKFRGTKLLHGGVKNVGKGGHRIGNHYKIHQFFKGGNIKKTCVKMYTYKKNKPKIIGGHKVFAKGNLRVKRRFNGVIVKGKPPL